MALHCTFIRHSLMTESVEITEAQIWTQNCHNQLKLASLSGTCQVIWQCQICDIFLIHYFQVFLVPFVLLRIFSISCWLLSVTGQVFRLNPSEIPSKMWLLLLILLSVTWHTVSDARHTKLLHKGNLKFTLITSNLRQLDSVSEPSKIKRINE